MLFLSQWFLDLSRNSPQTTSSSRCALTQRIAASTRFCQQAGLQPGRSLCRWSPLFDTGSSGDKPPPAQGSLKHGSVSAMIRARLPPASHSPTAHTGVCLGDGVSSWSGLRQPLSPLRSSRVTVKVTAAFWCGAGHSSVRLAWRHSFSLSSNGSKKPFFFY